MHNAQAQLRAIENRRFLIRSANTGINERNATLARRALYNIGEIRILKNVNPEEGKARLNKVIELNDKDILAVQARRLLDRIK